MNFEKAPPRHPAVGPTSTPVPASQQSGKTYVFVDPESRTHKRVKVVRACQGCRRRKIKCDSATTNTWPCAACSRLKITCVPPKVSFENASHSAAAAVAAASASSLQTTFALVKPRKKGPGAPAKSDSVAAAPPAFKHQTEFQAFNPNSALPAGQPSAEPQPAEQHSFNIYPQPQPQPTSLAEASGTSRADRVTSNPFGYYTTNAPSTPPIGGGSNPDQSLSPQLANLPAGQDEEESADDGDDEVDYYEMYSDEDTEDGQEYDEAGLPTDSPTQSDDERAARITEALGDLKIEPNAVAPYMKFRNKRSGSAHIAHLPEVEPVILNTVTSNSTIQIPPEMMPSDEKANQYFSFFFEHVHPYVPVLNSAQFYSKWNSNRKAISPFLLDGIFACASSRVDNPAEGARWLAVAAKHEQVCELEPDLSTLQSMVLVLKAQEYYPKKGYFYRSWMSVVRMVALARDLELDLHAEAHLRGDTCDDIESCGEKTRVWHMLFILENMIGGPQGKSFLSFGVPSDSIDFNIPDRIPGFDQYEMSISRQFTSYLRVVRNVNRSGILMDTLKKKTKVWALEHEFVAHNAVFSTWLEEAPTDLQVVYPPGGAAPVIPSTFMGNVTCYHYLSLLMQYRAQIETMMAVKNPGWKPHFKLCYESAKNMCRIQEVILRDHSLDGLINMQRGISFTIYCVLTCVMIHLVAVTSPERETSKDAGSYFSRHMRVLEACAPSWPLPEVQAQINALREAFSVDVNKPFELKKGLIAPKRRVVSKTVPGQRKGHGSKPSTSTLPNRDSSSVGSPVGNPHGESKGQLASPTISDPTDGVLQESSANIMRAHDQHDAAGDEGQQPFVAVISPPTAMVDVDRWDPSQIFQHWNTAFGTPQPQPVTPQAMTSPLSRVFDSGQSNFDHSSPCSEVHNQHHDSQTSYPYTTTTTAANNSLGGVCVEQLGQQDPLFSGSTPQPGQAQVQPSQFQFVQPVPPQSYSMPMDANVMAGSSMSASQLAAGFQAAPMVHSQHQQQQQQQHQQHYQPSPVTPTPVPLVSPMMWRQVVADSFIPQLQPQHHEDWMMNPTPFQYEKMQPTSNPDGEIYHHPAPAGFENNQQEMMFGIAGLVPQQQQQQQQHQHQQQQQ